VDCPTHDAPSPRHRDRPGRRSFQAAPRRCGIDATADPTEGGPVPTTTTQAAGPAHPATFRALPQHECLALLARNHVGRLAFAFHDRVDIQPLHYVYEAGWLYGRTTAGAKLATLAHNHWVAFEVDAVRGTFDWESVVVRGSFHRLDEWVHEGTHAHALSLLRTLVPDTLTAHDPTPERTVFFRIAVGEMTGRAATSGAAAAT
jgi:nitroimidazol reductase NimA-like FMN-containing flavoprotein (pyridoxamine 5'-phosphate oxidase superfamily)